MKQNRVALIISALLIFTLGLTGCGGGNSSGGDQVVASSSSGRVIGSASTIYLELNGGEKRADISDKEQLKQLKSILNNVEAAEGATPPEDEESSILVEWDGGDNSYYVFVYQMADGSSLIEKNASGVDEDPKYFAGASTYGDLETFINSVAE